MACPRERREDAALQCLERERFHDVVVGAHLVALLAIRRSFFSADATSKPSNSGAQACPSRTVPSVRTRKAPFQVVRLTELRVRRNPFASSAPGRGSPAIMPRVADANRIIVFGFGTGDAKLF